MSIESGGSSVEGQYDFTRQQDTRRSLETMATPEARADIIREIALLLAWLIEAGPGADPTKVRAARANLHAGLSLLGIDLYQPQWHLLFSEVVAQAAYEREHPRKPDNYPDFTDFAVEVAKLMRTHPETLGDLRGRDGMELSTYLYGLGLIMSSRLSYKYIFPDSDPIIVDRSTGHIDGRHRYITLRTLENLGFPARADWYWVRIHVINQ